MSETGGELSINHDPRPQATLDRESRFREELEKGNPLVTGRWGEIRASAPNGFIIKTDEVQGRLEVPEYPARENIVEANRREREFHQALEYEKAKREGREPENLNIDEVSGDPKAVVRGWKVEEVVDPETHETRKVLKLIIAGNSYAGYRAMSGVNAGAAEKAQGMIMGVAMGIVTNDGHIIMQKRGKNATYGDDIDADPEGVYPEQAPRAH